MASLGESGFQGQGDHGSFEPVHEPGYAMLIVNIKPKGNNGTFEFNVREGANEDSPNLQTVFIEKLGFKWINADCHEDVTIQEWDHRKVGQPDTSECKCLRCRITKTDHSRSKCFVLAISTHGWEITETEILFSDGNSILLTEIFEALNDKNCPSLAGKARIIILQVCRSIFRDPKKVSDMQDKGRVLMCHNNPEKVSDMQDKGHVLMCHNNPEQSLKPEPDKSSSNDRPKSRFRVEPVEDHSLQQIALAKMPNHYLLLYPVVSGQKAKRNAEDGSWLLHAMNKIVQERYSFNAKPVNFLHLITEVSGYVARERESIKYKKKKVDNTPEGHQDETSDATGENRKKKTKNDWEIDEENSGFKNAVCSYHRLCYPIIFYPKEVKQELPAPPKLF